MKYEGLTNADIVTYFRYSQQMIYNVIQYKTTHSSENTIRKHTN